MGRGHLKQSLGASAQRRVCGSGAPEDEVTPDAMRRMLRAALSAPGKGLCAGRRAVVGGSAELGKLAASAAVAALPAKCVRGAAAHI